MQPNLAQRTASIAVVGPIILATVRGTFFGALLGWFFLARFFLLFANMFGLPRDRFLYTLIIAALGGLRGFVTACGKIRRAQLTRIAALELELDYVPSANKELLKRLQRGFLDDGSFSFSNIAQKQVGDARFLLAEMQHQDGGAETKTRQTVAYYECAGMRLPSFELRPAGESVSLFSSISALQEINMDDRPEFSKQYLLSAADEGQARKLFGRAVCEYFAKRPGCEVRGEGERIFLFRRRQHVEPAQLESFLEQATEIFSLLDEASLNLES